MAAKIVIVYHSGYGKTKVQAEHVLRGMLGVRGVEAVLMTTADALKDMNPLHGADCLVFGCPTYMGGVSAKFKEFAEATSAFWMEQKWNGKLASGFTNSGGPSGDKLHALEGLFILAMQHGMVWVGTGMVPGAESSVGDAELNRLSSYIGAMSQTSHGSAKPHAADLVTAERFGRRVAETTIRWVRGKS